MTTTRTTSKSKKQGRPAGGRGYRARKVWRIFRFKERFELPDDYRKCRVTPLLFVKDYVGVSAGDEAANYHNQFRLLSNRDGMESLMLFGCYRQLVTLAACHSRAKRGYLLDPKDAPLSTAQLAKLLNIQTEDMLRILKRFSAVDLLEHVDMPTFDLSENEAPPEKEDDSDTQKPASRGRKQGSGGTRRKRAEISADGCAPLINGKTKAAKGKGKATSGLAASGCKRKRNDKRQKESEGAEALQTSQDEAPSQSPPTNPEPLPSEPHEVADAGQAKVIPFTGTCPNSVQDIIAAPSSQGEAYGRRVYLALKLPWAIDSVEAAREIGSFASKHDELCRKCSALSPPQIDTLLSRGLKEASKMSRRSANRNRGAVWNTAMNRVIAKHTGSTAQGRSPPKAEIAG